MLSGVTCQKSPQEYSGDANEGEGTKRGDSQQAKQAQQAQKEKEKRKNAADFDLWKWEEEGEEGEEEEEEAGKDMITVDFRDFTSGIFHEVFMFLFVWFHW